MLRPKRDGMPSCIGRALCQKFAVEKRKVWPKSAIKPNCKPKLIYSKPSYGIESSKTATVSLYSSLRQILSKPNCA